MHCRCACIWRSVILLTHICTQTCCMTAILFSHHFSYIKIPTTSIIRSNVQTVVLMCTLLLPISVFCVHLITCICVFLFVCCVYIYKINLKNHKCVPQCNSFKRIHSWLISPHSIYTPPHCYDNISSMPAKTHTLEELERMRALPATIVTSYNSQHNNSGCYLCNTSALMAIGVTLHMEMC